MSDPVQTDELPRISAELRIAAAVIVAAIEALGERRARKRPLVFLAVMDELLIEEDALPSIRPPKDAEEQALAKLRSRAWWKRMRKAVRRRGLKSR